MQRSSEDEANLRECGVAQKEKPNSEGEAKLRGCEGEAMLGEGVLVQRGKPNSEG